jgi:hypothetical protein
MSYHDEMCGNCRHFWTAVKVQEGPSHNYCRKYPPSIPSRYTDCYPSIGHSHLACSKFEAKEEEKVIGKHGKKGPGHAPHEGLCRALILDGVKQEEGNLIYDYFCNRCGHKYYVMGKGMSITLSGSGKVELERPKKEASDEGDN